VVFYICTGKLDILMKEIDENLWKMLMLLGPFEVDSRTGSDLCVSLSTEHSSWPTTSS